MLFNQIDSIKQIRKKVHRKIIIIQLIDNINDYEHCQVIYADKNKGFDINAIVDIVRGQNTLLITENCEFHRSMINFVIVNNEKGFEVNEHMLDENNLRVPSLFLASAVNNKRDWESLFYKADSLLINEQEIVKNQEYKIEQQNSAITEQFNRIVSQKNKIFLQKSKIENQQNELENLSEEINEKQNILNKQHNEIVEKENELGMFKTEIEKQVDLRKRQDIDIERNQSVILDQNEKIFIALDKIDKQRMYIFYFVVLVLILVAFAIFIYRSYKLKHKINRELKEKNEAILERNEEITQQKEEISAQRDEIEEQRDKILTQNNEIRDSIMYARRIQNAVLPLKENLDEILNDYFIFYLPRDIVSGDFYWAIKKDGKTILVVSDCTGHGVPGAFMSMLGVSFLNEIVAKSDLDDAAHILEELRTRVKTTLSQTGQNDEATDDILSETRDSGVKDGMDMVLCIIDETNSKMQFAGANNPIYLIRDKDLIRYNPDKMPIGIFIGDNKPFTNNEIELKQNDNIYMFTDGFADQFGGDKGKKFNRKRLKELLIDISDKAMSRQKNYIKEAFYNWISDENEAEGRHAQVDDVLIFGLKIS
jgi:serine phosphatase RsbU (regulator of sigma subunit)